MKLQEALTQRGDLMKRQVELRKRATDNARWQEGERPPEDAMALAGQWLSVSLELSELVAKINRTNLEVRISDPDVTLTEALSLREMYGRERRFWTDLADAAAGVGKRDRYPFGREEIKWVTELPVTDLRTRADKAAQSFRGLDLKIQAANFENDLVE